MNCATIPPLSDMCATSIVYRYWTYQNTYKNRNAENHWKLLEDKVTSNIKELPLPELLKSLLVSFVKPAGWHFYGFLHHFHENFVTSEKWLTENMLPDCLTLYPVGIINYRKTAENLLVNRMMDNVIAFRLACINFLEVEVLRLWPRVSRHFLNKIVFEYHKVPAACSLYWNGDAFCYSVREPWQVLLWISHCLSKEIGIDFREIPHFDTHPLKTCQADWFSEVFEHLKVSADVAIFEYFKKFHSSREFDIDYFKSNHNHGENYLVSFSYHFCSVNAEEKLDLFNAAPLKFLHYFLQWPLSSLFLKNAERIYDLCLGLGLVDWLFVKILVILHSIVCSCQLPISFNPDGLSESQMPDPFCPEHLESIFSVLWKLSPETTRKRIVASAAFTTKFCDYLEWTSSKMNFDRSTLKEELKKLFLSKAEAFLMLFQKEGLAEALQNIASKYMPEKKLDFKSFPQGFAFVSISGKLVIPNSLQDLMILHNRIAAGLYLPSAQRQCEFGKLCSFRFLRANTSVQLEFVRYIQEFLFESNMNNLLFHS